MIDVIGLTDLTDLIDLINLINLIELIHEELMKEQQTTLIGVFLWYNFIGGACY